MPIVWREPRWLVIVPSLGHTPWIVRLRGSATKKSETTCQHHTAIDSNSQSSILLHTSVASNRCNSTHLDASRRIRTQAASGSVDAKRLSRPQLSISRVAPATVSSRAAVLDHVRRLSNGLTAALEPTTILTTPPSLSEVVRRMLDHARRHRTSAAHVARRSGVGEAMHRGDRPATPTIECAARLTRPFDHHARDVAQVEVLVTTNIAASRTRQAVRGLCVGGCLMWQ